MDGPRDRAVERLNAAAIEPVLRSRASGARARSVTAVWLLGLAGVVGVAVAGRLTEPVVPGVTVAALVAIPPSPPPAAATARPTGRPGPNVRLSPVVQTSHGDDGLMGGLAFAGD